MMTLVMACDYVFMASYVYWGISMYWIVTFISCRIYWLVPSFKEVIIMKNSAAITFKNVNYSADGVAILHHINGFFPKGKITSLVGPSGAGKTTVFKHCNGLRSPQSGDIYLDGQPLHTYEPVKLRRRVGLALQDATMISGSVRENLALPLTLQHRHLSNETAQEYTQVVGLDADLLNQKARDLSGGQRQKLSLARTLINKPDVLLCDEITSSLDQISRQDIEQLIISINKTYETTIIWITHSIEQARQVSDYTWVMIAGRLVESGDSELLHDPHHEDVRAFLKGEVE